jgi:LmbE family N-acetylglucosaminyl deacetylase
MNDNKRVLLLLTAHADDTEFFAGGTVARFAAEGWRVIEVIATDNSRGSFELDSRTLVEQSRRVEAAAAAKIIGKDEVEFLGYPDGYLDDTPKNTLREIYMRRIRMHRPSIVMTFDAWAQPDFKPKRLLLPFPHPGEHHDPAFQLFPLRCAGGGL